MKAALEKAMQGHILAQTTLIGTPWRMPNSASESRTAFTAWSIASGADRAGTRRSISLLLVVAGDIPTYKSRSVSDQSIDGDWLFAHPVG